jgi:hypothetical protein
MKSFKQYISESTALMDLINKHDDPFSFLASAMDAIANGTLKLKQRGLANARELIAAWNKVKKRKIKLKEATEYILERRQDLVKGWTFKNKIATSTTDYNYYHIQHIIKEPKKFGLDKKKILKIIEDSAKNMSVPNIEAYVEDQYESLGNGIVDNDVYIEEYLKKKGYCMFVVDKTHGSVEGWDEKSCKLGAKAVDDNYLPYERDGFKLFEIKPVKGRPKYITNKFDFNDFVGGKKERKYVSPMAQFREAKQQPTEYVLWGVPPGEREEVLVLDAPGGKPITKLSDAKKYKEILEKEHGVKKIRIQTIDFSQDLSKMFSGKNIVR